MDARPRTARFRVALEAPEVGTKFGSGVVAQVAIFLEGFIEDALEFGGNGGVEARGFGGVLVQDCVKNTAARVAGEGKKAGGHFVEDDAERKKIGARIEGLAQDLFG